ncbi:MAG: PAS domain S-box protein [Acidimicrobiales bacterium]|nr:PAS domain S-box protein [Acidimicrobiales bacterium]
MARNTERRPLVNDPAEPLDLRAHDEPDGAIAWAMVEASPDALVVVDDDGLITLVNSQTEVLFGYDRTELLGQPVEMLLNEELRSTHVAHRRRFAAHPGVRSMGSGLELSALRADGAEFPVEISLSPLKAHGQRGVIAAIRDVTERVEAQVREREIATRFRSAFGDGPVPMTIAEISPDSDRVIVEANQAMADLLGCPIEHLIGRSIMDFGHPDDRRADDEATAAQLSNEEPTFTTRKRYIRADGTTVWVQLTVAILHREGDLVRTIAHSIDITAEVLAEAQKARNQEALEQARLAEQRAELLEDRERIGRDMHDKVIGRLFATGMTVQATAAVVTDQAIRERLTTAVAEIDEGIREIRTTIYGLRSQMDWGKGVRGEILAAAVDHSQALGFEPRVDLTGPIDDLSPSIAVEMLAALREALTNASKYARANAVTIAVTLRDDHLKMSVSDNGLGFVLPDHATTSREGEPFTGKGLANIIARAEALGGNASIDSLPGAGTTVLWTVPASPNSDT